MLFLLFEMGHQRYAMDVRQIAAVLPLVSVRRIPQAPPVVQGLVNYRGAPVPVVDVSQLALGRPSASRLSTRIVIVNYPGEAGKTHLLGLIAERATRTVRREASDFVPSGLTPDSASYLGPVAADAGGLLQWIDVQTLLPSSLRDLLFKEPMDDQWGSPPSKTC
jgi:chemotaxis-related protein WspB